MAFIEVWRQTLVEIAKVVDLEADHFPVKDTPKRRLRQVDFMFEGNEIRGLEQNPQTKSRRAEMARWQESDAVPWRGSLGRKCGRWEGGVLRRAGWNESLRTSHCRFPRVLRLRFELPFSWRVGARELSLVGGFVLVFTRPQHGGDLRKVNRKLTWKGIEARGFSGLFRNPHVY